MNNDNFDNFIEHLESIKMTRQEKDDMRNRLRSFADAQALTPSPYIRFARIAKRGVAVAFIALFSIGSVSNLAAQGTLPGDTLYPVKIAHEEIKLAATFNKVKKIEYEIERTEKRILEAAEILETQPEDTEAKEVISKEIKQQTEKVHAQIENVKQNNPEDALELNTNLKTRLQSSSKKIKEKTEEKQNPTTETGVITTVMIQSDFNKQKLLAESSLEPSTDEPVDIVESIEAIMDDLEEVSPEKDEVDETLLEEVIEDALSERKQPLDEENNDTFTRDLLEKISEEEAITSQVETEIIEALGSIHEIEESKTTEILDNLEKEKVIILQQEIAEHKEENDITDHAYSVSYEGEKEIIFDEALLQKKVKEYISEKNYFDARLILEEIKDFYLAEPVVLLPEIILEQNADQKEEISEPTIKDEVSEERVDSTTSIKTQIKLLKESTA